MLTFVEMECIHDNILFIFFLLEISFENFLAQKMEAKILQPEYKNFCGDEKFWDANLTW
jgi:hypothetical protein